MCPGKFAFQQEYKWINKTLKFVFPPDTCFRVCGFTAESQRTTEPLSQVLSTVFTIFDVESAELKIRKIDFMFNFALAN